MPQRLGTGLAYRTEIRVPPMTEKPLTWQLKPARWAVLAALRAGQPYEGSYAHLAQQRIAALSLLREGCEPLRC